MRHGVLLSLILAAPLCGEEPKKPDYPPSRVENVVEVIHGVKVYDPYRWLETGDSDEVKAWTEKQNGLTRTYLDQLPQRKRLTERIEQLLDIGTLSPGPVRGGTFFFLKRESKQNQAVLYKQARGTSELNLLLDPNKLSPDGTTAVDWYFPRDHYGELVYGLSENGNEQSTLHDPNGAKISHTRACSVAWANGASGFYYTRYPEPGSVPKGEERYHRRVYFHKSYTDPKNDPLVFGSDLQMTDWPNVFISPNERWLVVEVEKGWARNELWLLDRTAKEPKWVALAKGENALYKVSPQNDTIYVRTNEGAPNFRIFAVDPKWPQRKEWKEVIPETEDVLDGFGYYGEKFVCHVMRNATSVLKLYFNDGKFDREIPLPGVGSITGVSGEAHDKQIYFGFHSFTRPPAIYRYNVGEFPADAEPAKLVETLKSDIDFSQYEVKQLRFPSKDGTEVSMFLAGKKGIKRDGKNPTLLWAYGGFNISITPNFLAHRFAFLEKGGLLAIPNIRGGGEYGEKWHEAGMFAKKQNVFDDYIAAAEYLVKEKYTSPEFLCGEGRSNGGLLMGAVLTQRPDLFKAIVCGVPLLDMVRYHKFLIAKLWIPEFGNPDENSEFPFLYAYSPYHRVKDPTKYPAVLIHTADSDTRVDPMHARKMTARLQAATGSNQPILLRVETKAGHGVGKPRSKQVEELADIWSFVFEQLGMQ